jgi:hypothetical protein
MLVFLIGAVRHFIKRDFFMGTDSFRAATCLKPVGGEPTTFLTWRLFLDANDPAKAAVTISESPNRIVVTAVKTILRFP